MEQFFKKVKANSLSTSLVCILVGIVLILRPEMTSGILCYVLGGVLIACGVLSILDFVTHRDGSLYYILKLIAGVILAAVGIWLISNPHVIAVMVPRIIGVFVCIHGLGNLVDAFRVRTGDPDHWLPSLAASLITIALGCVLVFHSFAVFKTAVQVIGFFLLFAGLCGLLVAWQLRRSVKLIEKAEQEAGGFIDVDYEDVTDDE